MGALALSGRRPDVGVRELVAFDSNGSPVDFASIGKAIAEIQLGGMTAAFAEISIGVACNSSLGFGHGLNDDVRLFDQIVEPPAGHGIRLASMMTAAPTKLAADTRRMTLFSIACAQVGLVARDSDYRRLVRQSAFVIGPAGWL